MATGHKDPKQSAPIKKESAPLCPNGREWISKGPTHTTIKSDTINDKLSTSLRWSLVLNGYSEGDRLPQRSFADYFKLAFPMQIVPTIISRTSAELKLQHEKPITEEEFFRYLGMRLIIARINLSNINEYWKVESGEHDIHAPYAFGTTYGISKHRFEKIESCLCWYIPSKVLLTVFYAFRLF